MAGAIVLGNGVPTKKGVRGVVRMDQFSVLHQLRARGHMPEYDQYGPQYQVLSVPEPELVQDAIRRFQKFYGLPETGVLTPETEAQLVAPRCGHPDMMAVVQESAWGITDLTYWQQVAYPGVDPEELAADYALAVARVAAVCGVNVGLAPSSSAANIVAVSGNIDGPWNVLALSELPPPGNTHLVLNQRFDPAEVALTRTQRQAMMAHEFCHCLGLGHAPPGSGALMEPVLGTITTPQAWDTRELLARYPMTGEPSPGPGPGLPPESPPPLAGVPVTGTGSIVTTRQAGAQYTVGLDAAGKYMILVVPLP